MASQEAMPAPVGNLGLPAGSPRGKRPGWLLPGSADRLSEWMASQEAMPAPVGNLGLPAGRPKRQKAGMAFAA
jgi:hypothetical protein